MAGARKITAERFYRYASESDMNSDTRILKQNQTAYILNTRLYKQGDGVSTLANLPYLSIGGVAVLANIQSATGVTAGIALPTGVSTNRSATPLTGILRINTTNAPPALEYYNGTNWMTVTAAISAV